VGLSDCEMLGAMEIADSRGCRSVGRESRCGRGCLGGSTASSRGCEAAVEARTLSVCEAAVEARRLSRCEMSGAVEARRLSRCEMSGAVEVMRSPVVRLSGCKAVLL
jgi:hypothetical protein